MATVFSVLLLFAGQVVGTSPSPAAEVAWRWTVTPSDEADVWVTADVTRVFNPPMSVRLSVPAGLEIVAGPLGPVEAGEGKTTLSWSLAARTDGVWLVRLVQDTQAGGWGLGGVVVFKDGGDVFVDHPRGSSAMPPPRFEASLRVVDIDGELHVRYAVVPRASWLALGDLRLAFSSARSVTYLGTGEVVAAAQDDVLAEAGGPGVRPLHMDLAMGPAPPMLVANAWLEIVPQGWETGVRPILYSLECRAVHLLPAGTDERVPLPPCRAKGTGAEATPPGEPATLGALVAAFSLGLGMMVWLALVLRARGPA